MSPVPDPESDALVLETLRRHDEHAQALLDVYRGLAEKSADEGIRYLCQLIIDDEERHHEVITEMVNRIESWVDGRDVEPGTPSLVPAVDRSLLENTRKLIELEHQDAKELQHLHKELRYAPATSLLPLLVNVMLHDTAKHIEMLRFIRTYSG
jgi:hypothetical protein